MTYNPRDYWEKRLSQRFSLSGVGHISFGERYNRWCYKAKTRVLEKALSCHNVAVRNKTVCDIGCGTGFFVDFYALRGAEGIVGIDITNSSVENLKKRYPHYLFVKGDISHGSVVEEINRTFDIINVFDVMYHIKEDMEFSRAISNIAALTKREGFIILSDKFGCENSDDAEHVKKRSREVYEKAFSKKGVDIVAAYPLFYILNRPVFGAKFHSLLTIDNSLAPIYYGLDKILLSSRRNNLNLVVAKKSAG